MSVIRRVAAGVIAIGVVALGLVVTGQPASANTNFNHSCEVTEACIYDGTGGSGYLWDFEGTDTDLSNNWYPYSGAPTVNNNSRSLWGRGGSCTAAWGPNIGGQANQPWFYLHGPGGAAPFTIWAQDYDTISSQWWIC